MTAEPDALGNDVPSPLSIRSKQEIIAELEPLSHQPGFIYAFATVLRRDLYFDPRKAAEINWRERLSCQELSLLAGLMLKVKLTIEFPTEEDCASQIEKIDALFRELHDAYNAPTFEALKRTAMASLAEKGPPVISDAVELDASDGNARYPTRQLRPYEH